MSLKSFPLVVAMVVAYSASAEYVPEPWNCKARQEFAAQRFGIFIHWGLYANYAQGEWYQYDAGIDPETYGRAMDGFYPSKFDAQQWAEVFRKSGAKYVTITSRHHEGFSMWPTKVDDGFNVANSPFRRDVLGELAKACADEGLQFNLYYSLLDWHRRDFPAGKFASKMLGEQKGDYPSYKRFMLGQLEELIDRYHPGVIWFDGEWEHARNDDGRGWRRTLDWGFDELYDFIHSKKVLVANNNHQPIRAKEDVQLFERDLPGENGEAGYSKYQPVSRCQPIEQCDVIQQNVWGYMIKETKFRTSEEVVALIARAAANGANLLLNIGPDGAGRLPERAVEVLETTGKWFEENGESIYGTDAGDVSLMKDVVSTRNGRILYLHFITPAVTRIAFGLGDEIVSVKCLVAGIEAKYERTDSGVVVVTIARPKGNRFDIVVKLELR